MASNLSIYEGAFEIFGQPGRGNPLSAETLGKCHARFPLAFFELLQQYGACPMQAGWLWLADPDALEPVLEELFGGDEVFADQFVAFLYDAFGSVYLWNPNLHTCATIRFSQNIITTYAPEFYLLDPKDSLSRRKTDDELIGACLYNTPDELAPRDANGERLFSPALQSLGQLGAGEMYGLFPPVALGGTFRIENLKRVKVVEHLAFLASLGQFAWREYIIDGDPAYPFGHDRLVRAINK